jgi:hypothetical protein
MALVRPIGPASNASASRSIADHHGMPSSVSDAIRIEAASRGVNPERTRMVPEGGGTAP